MMRKFFPLLAALALFPVQAAAQSTPEETEAATPALSRSVGADLHYSVDADDTEVVKIGANFDLQYKGPEEYLGFRLEKATFNPLGRGWQSDRRAYLRLARPIGEWKLATRLGTDGNTLLGAASIHNEARNREEYFIEREIVETPQGLARGIYYTFAGAVLDLPVDDRNIFTVMAGLQKFTGDNVRTHLRGNFIHVVEPELGLSVQLRGRFFGSSDPGEFDYYSPRWYAEVLPVLQIRRFSGGWRYSAAAGLGGQGDSKSGWRPSHFFNAQVTSPAFQRNWSFDASILYSNVPVASGFAYSYARFTLGLRHSF